MELLRSSCDYCSDNSPDNKYSQCRLKFHYDCAKNRGELRVKQESGELLSSGSLPVVLSQLWTPFTGYRLIFDRYPGLDRPYR